jgi:hypothetical protein
MTMGEFPSLNSINRNAIFSLISAILTLVSFCVAVAPIPFTGLFCYPASTGLGLVAFSAGLISLRQIQSNGGDGRNYALIGLWIGILTTLASVCAMTLGVLWLPVLAAFLHQVSK